MESSAEFDKLWDDVGTFGRYQVKVFVALQISILFLCGTFALNSYNFIEPRWYCDDGRSDIHLSSDCSVRNSCLANNFHVVVKFNSMINEWQLFCNNAHLAELITSAQLIAIPPGLLILGVVSDRYGRKLTLQLSICGLTVYNLLVSFSDSWQEYLFFRFWGMFFFGAAVSTVLLLSMESSNQRYRFLLNAASRWNWTYMVIALMGYLSANWRQYNLVLTISCGPLCYLVYQLFIVESPRWQLRKGKLEAAAKGLNYIAANNGRARRFTADQLAKYSLESDNEGTHFELFRLIGDRQSVIYTLVLGLCFGALTLASGSVILDIGHLSGSPFLNFFYLGALRIPFPVISVYLDWHYPQFGRRPFFMLSAGLMTFLYALLAGATMWLPETDGAFWIRILSILCTTCASFYWVIAFQYAFELYPTVIRTTAVALLGMVDGIFALLTPEIVSSRRYSAILPPSIIFGINLLALILGSAIFPETKYGIRNDEQKPIVQQKHT